MNSLIYTSFVVLIFSSFSFAQVKYTWNNSASSWQTESNWTPNGIPVRQTRLLLMAER